MTSIRRVFLNVGLLAQSRRTDPSFIATIDLCQIESFACNFGGNMV